MLLSMTGFGHGESELNLKKFSIDIKSVNGKFLDLNIKISRQFFAFEDIIKKIISEQITRGTVDVFVNYSDANSSSENLKIDLILAQKLKDFSDEIAYRTGLQSGLQSKDLLRFPDVLISDNSVQEIDSLKPILIDAVKMAVANHYTMRQTEGLALEKDLVSNLNNIENTVLSIQKIAPSVSKDYATKLKQRIVEGLGDNQLDEARLINEITFFVDKSDINEEIVRLHSHIAQFRKILSEDEPAGRKLEFLSQEMLRETNTIGSKANNLEITKLVLYQKNELEKIKEQIRNVE